MRRGSLEYWPHRRAKKQMPRVRNWPASAEPAFLGTIAIKAGMTHIAMIDDTNSPAKGSEVVRPVTVLEFPKVHIYGIRFYKRQLYKEPFAEVYDKNLAQKVGIKKSKETKIETLKTDAAIDDVTALAFVDIAVLEHGNKRVMRFEIGLGGKDVADKTKFIEPWLGKELKAADVLKPGEYIDVKSISKGKGWTGVIKRFGVARLARKATQKVRHVGTLGAWHPPKVLYTVPHAGHMGYNYRTEINKRVLKVGTPNDANTVNSSGGFMHYGVVKGDYIVLEGSIPGPSKRMVRIRKAIRNKSPVKAPQITYISTTSKQRA